MQFKKKLSGKFILKTVFSNNIGSLKTDTIDSVY